MLTKVEAACNYIAEPGHSSYTPSSRNRLTLARERPPGTSMAGTIITGLYAAPNSFADDTEKTCESKGRSHLLERLLPPDKTVSNKFIF